MTGYPVCYFTHNTVEDTVQRPTSDVGGVYSREAIAAGMLLRTELRLHPIVTEAIQAHHVTWWERLNGTCRMGVSRKDDYGLVKLSVQGPPQPVPSISHFDLEHINRLTVWLLSDVLVRDDALRPAVVNDCLCKALEARLDVQLKAAEPATRVPLHEFFFSSTSHRILAYPLGTTAPLAGSHRGWFLCAV